MPARGETGRGGRSRRQGTWDQRLPKYLSLFSNTRLLLKKFLRTAIFYIVIILCLYPLAVFKNKILFVLYLFLWTNIALAVAAFLDELFDLPRKR